MRTTKTNKFLEKGVFTFLSFLLLLPLFIIPSSAHASADIVNPNQVYSYKVMQRDIERLAEAYPNLISYQSLGKTKYGRDLWAVKLGRGESVLFLNGSHHAREWMTTSLLMKMIETYALAYTANTTISSYEVRSLLDSVTIWIVPMVNPDGVTLAQQGTAGLPAHLANTLRRYNGNSGNFARWKATMEGIDLNRHYPAGWSTIRNSGATPWYQNYKGKQPAQAPEVQMMMAFTKQIDPEMTISYHSSGEIIFWHYRTPSQNVARDKSIATVLANLTGYSLVKPEKNPSGGGYKDWFVQTFGRPGFTIEIADYAGERSVPLNKFGGIWSENRLVGLYTAKKSYDLWLEKQKVQYVEQPMDLLAGTPLYPNIGGGAATATAFLAPQKLTVTARKGDWVQVGATEGSGWIHPSPGMLTVVEPLDASVDVPEVIQTYRYPDAFSPKGPAISPQTVQVTGQSGEWLQIAAETGPLWIRSQGLELKAPLQNSGPEPEPEPEPAPEIQAPAEPTPENQAPARPAPETQAPVGPAPAQPHPSADSTPEKAPADHASQKPQEPVRGVVTVEGEIVP